MKVIHVPPGRLVANLWVNINDKKIAIGKKPSGKDWVSIGYHHVYYGSTFLINCAKHGWEKINYLHIDLAKVCSDCEEYNKKHGLFEILTTVFHPEITAQILAGHVPKGFKAGVKRLIQITKDERQIETTLDALDEAGIIDKTDYLDDLEEWKKVEGLKVEVRNILDEYRIYGQVELGRWADKMNVLYTLTSAEDRAILRIRSSDGDRLTLGGRTLMKNIKKFAELVMKMEPVSLTHWYYRKRDTSEILKKIKIAFAGRYQDLATPEFMAEVL